MLRQGVYPVARSAAGLGSYFPGEPKTPQGQGTAGRGKTRRLVNTHGVPPASARNLQQAVVQGALLYVSEIMWNGKKVLEGEYQAVINRMGPTTLGVFQSKPLGIMAGERPHPGARPPRLPTGSVHTATPSQATGTEGPRGGHDAPGGFFGTGQATPGGLETRWKDRCVEGSRLSRVVSSGRMNRRPS